MTRIELDRALHICELIADRDQLVVARPLSCAAWHRRQKCSTWDLRLSYQRPSVATLVVRVLDKFDPGRPTSAA